MNQKVDFTIHNCLLYPVHFNGRSFVEGDGYVGFDLIHEDRSIVASPFMLPFRIEFETLNAEVEIDLYELASQIVSFAETTLGRAGLDSRLVPRSVAFNYREDVKGLRAVQQLMNQQTLLNVDEISVADLTMYFNPTLRI